jgi:hypothetical protein
MLQKMLLHIEQGKPVNYQKLLQLLPPAFYQQRQQLFKVNSRGAGKWQVQVADAALFAQLKQSALAPADRITASWQGDSHQAPTSHSFLLVYHDQLSHDRPDLVLAAGGNTVSLSYDFTAKPALVLIENEENFFAYSQVLRLSSQMLAKPFSLSCCDVALAAGSRIGSALLTPFLQQYQQIWCAFDFDAAGLEIFDHLHKRYGTAVQLVCPPELTPWQHGFRANAKPAQLEKALALAEQHRLFGLAAAFRQHKAFLEQEILL